MSWIESASSISFPALGIEWNPPEGIQIGNLAVKFYGVLIALGIILAIWYACRRCKQFGLKEDDLIDGVLFIVPFAVLCARLYYCIFEWDSYKDNLWSIFHIWKGGLAIYGGVIGAVIGIVVFALVKGKKVKMAAVLDITSLGFLIGQSLGRWGNFFNREAFGAYCDNFFGMRISNAFLPSMTAASEKTVAQVELLKQKAVEGGYDGFIQVHPTFLYESLWNLAGFVLLHFLSKKRKYDGQIALGYLAWYGLGRTLIEGLRMDSLYWGNFRVSQLLAALTCFTAVAILMVMAFKRHNPKKLFVNVVAAREAAENQEPEEEEEDLCIEEESCDSEEEATVMEEQEDA